MPDRVLVTGISGFLGGHVALELLRNGYAVRGSIRDESRQTQVRAALAQVGAPVGRLDFCVLDLMDDRGWREAAADCRFTQHVASPFALTMPKDENALIEPAVAGTRRAIEAALDAGHERIVLTSSLAAIDGGHRAYDHSLGTEDWSELDGPGVTAYTKSKTLAEREAWALVEQREAREKLVVINPGTMLGPLLSQDPGSSAVVIQRMLNGEMPMVPDMILPYVDVRDVAAAHVAAMTAPDAGGQRHLVTNAAQPLMDIADVLRTRLPDESGKVPKHRMPTWFAPVFALFDPSLRDSKQYLGVHRSYDGSSGERLLGYHPRSTDDAVEITARSLIARNLVRSRSLH